jgi:hypothetical protein
MPKKNRSSKKTRTFMDGGDISNLSGKIARREADLGFFNEQRGHANTDERKMIDRQIKSMENQVRPLKKYKNREQDLEMFRGMLQDVPTDMKQDIQTKIRDLEQENAMLEAEITGVRASVISAVDLTMPPPPPSNLSMMGRPQGPTAAPQLLPSAPPAHTLGPPPSYHAQSQQCVDPRYLSRPIAQMRKNVKVLLTDLDNTLITNVQKEASCRYAGYNVVPFAESKFEHTAPVPDIDIITTEEIINFLHMVSLDDNILWFIVSAGANDVKLASLLKYANDSGRPLQYDNPGTEFGLKDKKSAVHTMLEIVGQNNTIENVLFIDDEEDKLQKVSELGVNVLPVDTDYYKLLDWWSPTMMTPNNVAQARQILGV